MNNVRAYIFTLLEGFCKLLYAHEGFSDCQRASAANHRLGPFSSVVCSQLQETFFIRTYNRIPGSYQVNIENMMFHSM